jgi:exodeoxyribonuclease V beta subunit
MASGGFRAWSESTPHEELKTDVHDATSMAPPAASAPAAGAESASEAASLVVERAVRALPGGAATGLFLHEALERVDLGFMATLGGPEDALSQEPGGLELRALLEGCAARNGVDEAHAPAAAWLLYHAVRTSLPTRDGAGVPLVGAAHVVREMSFQFPIPEAYHPSLTPAAASTAPAPDTHGAPFRVGRGVVRGVVDVVFEHEGAVYFLDWKSDRVDGTEAALQAHVRAHYELQIKLYTLGVLRLLDVWDADAYERRFGGHLYAFLRPLALAQPGLVFERPAFEDVQRWERDLLGQPFDGVGARGEARP